MTDSDCRLVGDCCDCVSISLQQAEPPGCDAACAVDRCTTLGVSAKCSLGRCTFDTTCDAATVTCERAEPVCPTGRQALVRGTCWVGDHCVDARDCDGVTGCEVCTEGQACMNGGELGGHAHCVDIAPECNGVPTCECMGNALCAPIQCGAREPTPSWPYDFGCFCIAC